MKKLIIWLAKIFNVNLATEKIIVKEVVKEVEKERRVALGQEVDGDLMINGTLSVRGSLNATGDIVCFKK